VDDQFSTKTFRCLKKSNPVIIDAKKTSEYQEYELKVSGHSLEETENILKKICDSHVPISKKQQIEFRESPRTNTKRFRLEGAR